jgi:hypothetical protein
MRRGSFRSIGATRYWPPKRGAVWLGLFSCFDGGGGILRQELATDGSYLSPAGYALRREAIAHLLCWWSSILSSYRRKPVSRAARAARLALDAGFRRHDEVFY